MKYLILSLVILLTACAISPDELRQKNPPIYEINAKGDYIKTAECIMRKNEEYAPAISMHPFHSEKFIELINSEGRITVWLYDVRQEEKLVNIKLWITPTMPIISPSTNTLKEIIDQCALGK